MKAAAILSGRSAGNRRRKNRGNAEHAGSEIRATAFLVSSITLDAGAHYAIINGKVMNEGQVFGLQMGNQTYQITVKAIQDGQVVLQRRDQEIVVPLRREIARSQARAGLATLECAVLSGTNSLSCKTARFRSAK